MRNFIRQGIFGLSLCAALVLSADIVLAQSGSTGGSVGNPEKTLSGERSAPSPEREAPRHHSREVEQPRRASRGGGGGASSYDGVWAYAGVATNCQGAGSGTLTIAGGTVSGPGGTGHVSPGGVYQSISVDNNGVTQTAFGRMSGNSGSGSFRRTDGCIGRWTAQRQ
jgi:hypothetical protein